MNPASARAQGFTLVELMVAMTMSAFVLLAAMTALSLLGEAGARTAGGIDQGVEVDRALRLFRRDVRFATSATVSGDRIVLVLGDGSAVVYERTPSADDLHRVTGDSQANAEAAADALSLSTATPARRSARGYLLDADYRASALLQDVRDVSWTALLDVSSQTIGIKLSLDYEWVGAAHTASACALLVPRLPISS